MATKYILDPSGNIIKVNEDKTLSEPTAFEEAEVEHQAIFPSFTICPRADGVMDNFTNFKDVMVDMYGIDSDRLETIGYGESRLLDTASNAEAHRVNRRISVTVKDTVKVPEEK